MRTRRLRIGILALVVIGVAACRQEAEPITTASGLEYQEIEAGDGPRPDSGQVVQVHYEARLRGDTTVIDESYTGGQPFQFVVGGMNILPGWSEGIQLMNVGGKGRLTMPPELAFGEEGYEGRIPPNATLVIDVELLAVREGAPESPAPVTDAQRVELGDDLSYVILKEGAGPSLVAGQTATVHYTGWLAETGQKFDSSIDNGRPYTLTVGAETIPGFSRGIEGMQIGERRQITIPPNLAYGEEGGGPIPPNATLIFEVELLDIAQPPAE